MFNFHSKLILETWTYKVVKRKLYIAAYDEAEWPMDTMYYATQNPDASDVLVVEAKELSWFLNTTLIKNLDKQNESEIHLGEDDWIPIVATRKACIKIIENWLHMSGDVKHPLVIDKLLALFKRSINDEKIAVYFIYQ